MKTTKTPKVYARDIDRLSKEILANARPGCTMHEADPYGVILQKKIANLLKERGA